MASDLKENIDNYRFPKTALIIVMYAGSIRFAYNCVRSILALYLVDVLQFEESQSVSFVHIFLICTVAFSLFGAMLCDSWLGQFKTILYFSTVLIIGLLLFLASSMTVLNLPRREITLVAVIVVALGFGVLRPCVSAFGGDQFVLPQQKKQLSLFFVLFCMANNIASLSNYFITPVLRKDLMCFQELTCYPSVFLLPAIFIVLSTAVIFFTKRLYTIKKPEGNVVLHVAKCMSHAMYQKIKSKNKRQHWLDYADDKFELKMIEDIKSVSRVLKLMLPMPIFWALFSMQSSTWTFQASRMDGEFEGYLIKPDQIQAIDPLFVIIFVPIFHHYVYPVLEKYFFLRTPLRKITFGCFIIAFAYVCSGALELNLEPTYAVTPMAGTAQLRIFNTLNCNVPIAIEERKFVLEKLNMWENISIPSSGKKFLKYKADFHDCEMLNYDPKLTQGKLEVKENQATSWVLTKEGLSYNFIDNVDKSISGNPLVRALIYVDKGFAEEKATLKITHNNKTFKEIAVSKQFAETKLTEVAHKKYDLYINDRLVESNYPIRQGGVYTVLGYVSNSTVVGKVVTVTEPNSVHILWILPQEILLSVSEIMVDVLMMEFAFSQAPPSMKTLLQSCWLFSAVFGNLIIIMMTEFKPLKRMTYEFFLYVILMVIGAVAFGTIAYFYKYKEYSSPKEENNDKEEISPE